MQITASLDFEFRRSIGLQQGKNSDGVYVAYDPQLDGEVVVKRIAKARLQMDATRFFQESRRLYDARHPNVVDVKYACVDGDYIYIAMPCYGGGSLESLLAQRYLTVREIVKYAMEFLSGLHHVHTRGLVHLDVKPSNVLIDDRNTCALTDFGQSAAIDAQGFATPEEALYAVHWPPEYLQHSLLSNVADIYQAGVTLYRMCNGNAWFRAQLQGHTVQSIQPLIVGGQFPDRKGFLPHIPKRLRRAIVKAMAADPDKRHQTALDLLNELALVNECLDWTYVSDPATGVQRWTRPVDTYEQQVTVSPATGGFAVRTERINFASQRTQQVAKFSGSAATAAEAAELARAALTGL
jgi:eukaryotic-like serine/threonine-protein kinase